MNTKTYTETKNYAPFDWYEALSKSEITDKEWNLMMCKASDWVTCAVGNQCDVIPRDEIGIPLDAPLELNGILFMNAVKRKDSLKALEVLGYIERRSAELIAKYSK